jgi:hypothetical protein
MPEAVEKTAGLKDKQVSIKKLFPVSERKIMKIREVKIMKSKLTFVKTLTLGMVAGVLIGYAVWNLDRVSAIGEVEGRVHFGIVTLLPASQNARLNFVRIDGLSKDPGEMQPCVIEVGNFDANGRAYGTPDTFELRPGAAVSRNVIPPGTTPSEGPFQFRATFRFIDDPNIRSRCEVIPTLEVYSKQTGGTLFNYPAARGYVPLPDPPALR